MGLWLKNEDGFVPVSGGGGSGGAGPHEHDDYLPLAGGVVTGDLQVSGQYTAFNGTSDAPTYSFWNDRTVGLRLINAGEIGLTGDLTVDGVLRVGVGDRYFKTSGSTTHSIVGNDATARPLLEGRSQNENGDEIRAWYVGYGYAASYNPGLQLFAQGDTRFYNQYWGGDTALTMLVKPTGVKILGDLQVDGIFTPAGGTAFGITEGIDTQDVLDRAETATMPAIDDEGVATADAEGVMLNDVVTALLLKVKELSAEIEELKAKDRPLKKQAAPRKKAATRKTTTTKKKGS